MTGKKKWPEILKELEEICEIHEQAQGNYEKCREFNQRLAGLLDRLEDLEYYSEADRVMGLLISCSPKVGSHCEKGQYVSEKLKEMRKAFQEET
ncbi:hypothetical protein MSMTP_0636 [Methanosarcina sp. MTP4]|uniref:hypothetical protein n=1 Tax=Methanosarcina sp. MTP4 TaxID=1434100 RepID=UPI00061589A7|nr:hypothetical protein [Methanosarcina sp. MTP4]AKB24105.1 hypothetical protein MSMTP_0636 [Methanosarcina sp. MTP4]